MTIDEDINNNFVPIYGCPKARDTILNITDNPGSLIKKLKMESIQMEKERKEKEQAAIAGTFTGIGESVSRVIHDESVIGIYQDKLTGDVILGQPQPVTTVDQSFSMRGITQLPPEDEELKAVVDPLIKTIKITATAPPEIEEIPIGFSVLPRGMFNRMRFEVWKYALNHLDKSDKIEFPFNEDTVYTVWTCKTLQNWKALISTSLKDGMYYECTYDGDKKKLYLDAYKKFEHQEIEFDNETEEKIKQENRVAATSSVKVRSFPRNE